MKIEGNLRTLLVRLGVAAAGVCCMAPGCNGDVLDDSTFRLWCGDSLCDWKLDAGHVKQAPTWHPDDYGVELLDVSTKISQTSHEGSPCMEFSAMADVAASALAKVEIDFNQDGVADFEGPIAETHWGKTRQLVQAPKNWGRDLSFAIVKDGGGHAVLAEIRLRNVDICTALGSPLRHVAAGKRCFEDAECESGVCGKLESGGKGDAGSSVTLVGYGTCQ